MIVAYVWTRYESGGSVITGRAVSIHHLHEQTTNNIWLRWKEPAGCIGKKCECSYLKKDRSDEDSVKKGGRWFSATRPGYRRRILKRMYARRWHFDFGVG